MWDGSYNNVTDFYPRSPCGERPEGASARIRPVIISIHALLAESDPQTPDTLPGGAISIHALLAESDSGHRSATRGCGRFLSTLSLRRATHPGSIFLPVLNFYPRSPCGERPHIAACGLCDLNFYPRSPCGERLGVVSQDCVDALFLSTLSLRRATRLQSRTYQAKDDFYPRSPCGERQGVSTMDNGVTQISIHALLAESDRKPQYLYNSKQGISIHALLAESDSMVYTSLSQSGHFYPRSPCGERRHALPCPACRCTISIHALLAESDLIVVLLCHHINNFYPRSPCGERR